MFKIYDLNYNEVRLPTDDLGYGLKSLDINIGPVIYENLYSQSSRADKLVKRYPKDRIVSINAMFTSYDTVDWRLKRDRVYSFFRNLGMFYVAESHQPFKLLKVIVDESYEIDRSVIRWGVFEIPLKIIDTPFKQSLHTTMDIDSEGIRFNDKWAYGMGLSSDNSEWKYKFTNTNPQFYNAGTEEIKLIQQKESVVRITAKGSTVNNLLDIDDGSTTFKLFRGLKSGDVLEIKGHQIKLNGQNVMQDTNRNFLTIKKRWNNWGVRGINKQFVFEIDFRFLYD